MKLLICEWTETEVGWGQRPDGISVHFSKEQCMNYIADDRDKLYAMYEGKTPHEYSYPDDNFYEMEVDNALADEQVTALILKGESMRFYKQPKWLKRI